MIAGFSNAPTSHPFHHLEFDSSMPMPFKIPAVLAVLLDPEVNLNYTQKQSDLIEALQFSFKAKTKMLEVFGKHEAELLHQMTQAGADTGKLKEEYDDIQIEKLESYEIFFDLINALADLLEPSQYQGLLEKAGIDKH